MIRQLPSGYRTVFNLFVIEGLSHQQIAAQLNIKADTSASQLYKAKVMLARMIKSYQKQDRMTE
jgi:RNA polymerase sigma-70 factor, ECF family